MHPHSGTESGTPGLEFPTPHHFLVCQLIMYVSDPSWINFYSTFLPSGSLGLPASIFTTIPSLPKPKLSSTFQIFFFGFSQILSLRENYFCYRLLKSSQNYRNLNMTAGWVAYEL